MKKMNKRLKHFADYLEEQRIFSVQYMDSNSRHRIISTLVKFILDDVINRQIEKNEHYIKHCIEFSDEYNETANVLDVLYVFRRIFKYLLEDNNDRLFQIIIRVLTEGDDKND